MTLLRTLRSQHVCQGQIPSAAQDVVEVDLTPYSTQSVKIGSEREVYSFQESTPRPVPIHTHSCLR